jgi:hypothetical protein
MQASGQAQIAPLDRIPEAVARQQELRQASAAPQSTTQAGFSLRVLDQPFQIVPAHRPDVRRTQTGKLSPSRPWPTAPTMLSLEEERAGMAAGSA